ncbi:PQQ-dependent sugar dehydrogenase [Echinicola strongylocentroti]|uniref:PQQ-dependent sugar dehydrogenase n=1 Tax=Echinicola strongylocentroti TaxID=1795355 RepID=A0A2Z4IPT5_9BACT|nr:PQQ-dependent sugar dehydrogenase [Echinicola strongylocentroti]AWW32566.1 PQQ-dependent sugar dehydrogenase [Echinicola strongylocentroti]
MKNPITAFSITLRITLFTFVFNIGSSCAQDNRPGVLEDTPPIEDDPKSYTVETIVEDINNPWGMALLPDGGLLITEKDGELIYAKDGEKKVISGTPEVVSRGQGGLLDIILHPDYATNGWIYLTFSSGEGGDGAHTAVMRAKFNGNSLTDQEVLYKASPNTRKGQHFGSRMAFDDEGYLFFSVGERGQRDVNPQDITRDGGKIYRINEDGSIPEDNPFYDEADAKKAIYSYGHRNPQGMLFHPLYHEIWVNEHGPQGGDEINVVKKGGNFGWPEVSYGIDYDDSILTEDTNREGMKQPLYYWVPSIAPCGFALVPEDTYPDWAGNLLVGSLKFQYLEMLTLDGKQVTKRTKLLDGMGRLRNVKIGPDNHIYVGIQGKGIVKIIPNP